MSRHMTGNISYFASLTKIDGPNVNFRNKGEVKICDEGTVGNSYLYIHEVIYVERLNII